MLQLKKKVIKIGENHPNDHWYGLNAKLFHFVSKFFIRTQEVVLS